MTLIDPVIQRRFVDVHGILIATKITRQRLSYFLLNSVTFFTVAIWHYKDGETLRVI